MNFFFAFCLLGLFQPHVECGDFTYHQAVLTIPQIDVRFDEDIRENDDFCIKFCLSKEYDGDCGNNEEFSIYKTIDKEKNVQSRQKYLDDSDIVTKKLLYADRAELEVSYVTLCNHNYYGEECEIYCEANDICEGKFYCTNEKGEKSKVSCSIGSVGPNCEYKIPWKPCLPGVSCSFSANCVQFHLAEPITCCPCHNMNQNCGPPTSCLAVDSCNHGHWTCDKNNILVCKDGWVGKSCHAREIDQSIDSECPVGGCLNGGSCFNQKCCCPTEYTGAQCEKRSYIDRIDCKESGCHHSGICQTDNSGESHCQCRATRTGLLCDIKFDDCPCEHGECVDDKYCKCYDGWIGDRCNIMRDPCDSEPCIYGNCLSNHGKFICVCNNGWTGQQCAQRINVCASSPCGHGKCIGRMVFDESIYSCDCFSPWTGKLCDELKTCDNKESIYCNTGKCDIDTRGERCVCPLTHTGDYCQTQVNYCTNSTCENGGTCNMHGTLIKCLCVEGFTGVRCEVPIASCSNHKCENGGTCTRINATAVHCNCLDDYYGDHCEYVYICSPTANTCQNGGKCITGEYSHNFRCECPIPYYGEKCEQINPCLRLPCAHDGVCINKDISDYYCDCPYGFSGKQCMNKTVNCVMGETCIHGECIDDKCSCINTIYVGASCNIPDEQKCAINCQNGYRDVEEIGENKHKCLCRCLPDYTGDLCEKYINICESKPCKYNGKCIINSNLTWSCLCQKGFTGIDCGQINHPCHSSPCKNNGNCIVLRNEKDYECICPYHWIGKNCDERLKPCTNLCKNDGKCIFNIDGSSHCQCTATFTGVYCELVIDRCQIDTCHNGGTCSMNDEHEPECVCTDCWEGLNCQNPKSLCNDQLCNGGTCIPSGIGCSYTCLCLPNYHGHHCENVVDRCIRNPCRNGKCVNDDETNIFSCECDVGFTGKYCDSLLPICLSKPCQNHGTCSIIIPGTYKCFCPLSTTGKNCETFVNPCEKEPCQHGATCINDGETYYCICPLWYGGFNCETDNSPCSTNPCEYAARCDNVLFKGKPDYVCHCPKGRYGKICSKYVCENKCLNGGTCQVLGNRKDVYKCLCRKEFTGKMCENVIDKCESFTCYHGKCAIVGGKPKCLCEVGYYGETCEFPFDICLSGPCKNYGDCIKTNNGYKCNCRNHYTGRRCETLINYCETRYCGEGKCNRLSVENGNGELYECICNVGYTGKNCDIVIDHCISNPCVHGSCEMVGFNKVKCTCYIGFKGEFCRQPIDVCKNHGCVNGYCEKNWDQTSYHCNCKKNYIGKYCDQLISLCEFNSDFCKFGHCKDTNNGPCCDCLPGYHTWNCGKHLCDDYCQNDGLCRYKNDKVICICATGFTGDKCEEHLSPCLSSPCGQNGVCFVRNKAKDNLEFHCSCRHGYTGQSNCVKVDYCQSNPCLNDGTCHNSRITYTCECSKNYHGKNCEKLISCCDAHPCQFGRCVELSNDKCECECSEGYCGKYCNDVKNECLNNNMCEHGLCVFDNAIAKCHCFRGFIGDKCDIEIDGCENDPCEHGRCRRQSLGSFKCECEDCYSGNICDIYIHPCMKNPCYNGGVCRLLYSEITEFNRTDYDVHKCEYRCECNNGWGGKNCNSKIDYCRRISCGPNGVCLQSPNGFFCKCSNGFHGKYCDNPPPCSLPFAGNYCKNNGLCKNKGKTYICECPTGYYGANCGFKMNYCEKVICRNGATCESGTDKFNCVCRPGFLGVYCEIDINECLSRPCGNRGTCIEFENGEGFKCLCTERFTGKTCKEPINFCDIQRCNNGSTCLNIPIGDYNFQCKCQQGMTGRYCSQAIDHCQYSPCKFGKCEKIPFGYKCVCAPGYTGKNCDVPVCSKVKCQNNGTCVGTHITCKCQKGFTGEFCEEPLRFCAEKPCWNLAKCVNDKCMCSEIHTGLYCENVKDPCRGVTCQNGCKCDVISATQFICFDKTSLFYGKYCEKKRNPCHSNPCNSGTCIVNGDIFTCQCPTDGEYDDMCNKRCDSVQCLNGGTCYYSLREPLCHCHTIYTGELCRECACENGGICRNNVCYCPPGFIGNLCEKSKSTCYDDCYDNGRCTNGECECDENFRGKNCDIPKCSAAYCSDNGRCYEMEKENHCFCFSNYEGDRCQNQLRKNQICPKCFSGKLCTIYTSPCVGTVCQNDGICVPDAENTCNYRCLCGEGYSGKNCEEKMSCSKIGYCGNGGHCHKDKDECQCRPYQSGKYCETDNFSFCGSNHHTRPDFCHLVKPDRRCSVDHCTEHGRCLMNEKGENTCYCEKNFEGIYCELERQTCHESYCHNGGTCIYDKEKDLEYCECFEYYFGTRCELMSNICLNDGHMALYGDGAFRCVCPPMYTGPFCENQVVNCNNECKEDEECKYENDNYECIPPSSLYSLQCLNDGVNYLNNGTEFCSCRPLFTGQNCGMKMDRCTTMKCENGGTCVLRNMKQQCLCANGFTGELCENKLFACANVHCSNGGTCLEGEYPNFLCLCPHQFSGLYCTIQLNSCKNDTCNSHGQCVEDDYPNFHCECYSGFNGQTCAINNEPNKEEICEKVRCLNGGFCNVTESGESYCNCIIPYTGKFCESIANLKKCKNGGTFINNINGGKCVCSGCFTGAYCEEVYNPCTFLTEDGVNENYCFGNSSCSSTITGSNCLPICNCETNVFGERCEIARDLCRMKNCMNNGICEIINSSASCKCLRPYFGENCEKSSCSEKGNCENHGQCIPIDKKNYRCKCTSQWIGETCSEPVSACSSNPCFSGGTCLPDDNGKSYICICPNEWEGNNCELIKKIEQKTCVNGMLIGDMCQCFSRYIGENCTLLRDDPCSKKPCLNGGQCYNRFGDEYICICANNKYTGVNCETEINCGEIIGSCGDGEPIYTNTPLCSCKCKNGEIRHNCPTLIDTCSSSPCRNGGECISNDDGWKCINCNKDMTGKHCSIPIDSCKNNICKKGTCIPDYELEPFYYKCKCLVGWKGRLCDEEYNVCDSNPCQNGGDCEYNHNSFYCSCSSGWSGKLCERLNVNCISRPCLNGGTCVETDNGYKCYCSSQTEGNECEILKKCTKTCYNKGICQFRDNSKNEYCLCPIGYTGYNCQGRIGRCLSFPCKNGGTCNDYIYQKICTCEEPFYGTYCELIKDHCYAKPCKNDGNCINLGKDYICECRAAFTGKDCQHKLAICNTVICENNGTCEENSNEEKGYLCRCLIDYYGPTCSRKKDLCRTLNPCQNGGKCITENLERKCLCDDTGHRGRYCELRSSFCTTNTCLNGAKCVDNKLDGYRCLCGCQFTGFNCEIKIGKESCDDMDCGRGKCVTITECENMCLCPKEFRGRKCENAISCKVHNPCFNGGQCSIVHNEHKCQCLSSFTGFYCERIIDKCASNPCANNGNCRKTKHSYYCECANGFNGKNCENELTFCEKTKCNNMGNCIEFNGTSGMCICPKDYVGIYCDKRVDLCSCENGGTCTSNTALNTGKCKCKFGYIGEYCEKVDRICRRHCLNNGKCVKNQNMGKDVCNCQNNFYGEYCERYMGSCQCMNGGICISEKCVCESPFTGKYCSEKIKQKDICSLFPCFNNGHCNAEGKCSCVAPYSGKQCELVKIECSKDHCLNGGQCSMKNNERICKCQSSIYSGARCEIKTINCGDDNLCNHNGKCQVLNNVRYCNCYNEFYGEKCEKKKMGEFHANCSMRGYYDDASRECDCEYGFTGKFCAQLIDNSNGLVCKNNGEIMFVKPGVKYCKCKKDFFGKDCSQYLSHETCLYGHHEIDENTGQRFCRCSPNWTGKYCQNLIRKSICSAEPCLNGGQCFILSTSMEHYCFCKEGYMGVFCENEKVKTPNCANGAKVNSLNKCECLDGFVGDYCEIEMNECLSSPCQNNAKCIDMINAYKCICNEDYTGSKCEVSLDGCKDNPCGGFPYGKCLNLGPQQFSCKCYPNYSGVLCKTELACASNPCKNGGTCSNEFDKMKKINSYKCSCRDIHTNDDCSPIDCKKVINCQNNGEATLSMTSGCICICPRNKMGKYCERHLIRIQCMNGGSGRYDGRKDEEYCDCLAEFIGKNCDQRKSPCFSNPCRNGKCFAFDGNRQFLCSCTESFTGKLCETYISTTYCTKLNCINGWCEKDECRCFNNFIGKNCEKKKPKCDAFPCGNNGECIELSNDYKCKCFSGYTGKNCQSPISHIPVPSCHICWMNVCGCSEHVCQRNPCMNQGKCYPMHYSYRCDCPVGYTGRNCQTKIFQCSSDYCLHGGTCEQYYCQKRCFCVTPYYGVRCEKLMNPCASNPCNSKGKCIDLFNGKFECQCTSGFGGKFCDKFYGGCQTQQCSQISPSHCQTINGLTAHCLCSYGTTGSLCEISLDPCAKTPCQNGAQCSSIDQYRYLCSCLSHEYYGENCEFRKNPCLSNPCQYGKCEVSKDNSNFNCQCYIDYEGEFCTIRMNYCAGHVCSNSGECYVVDRKPVCSCVPGKTGDDCELEMDNCFEHNCQNNGKCLSSQPNYKCICENPFSGKYCEQKLPSCYSRPCQNGGVCINDNNQVDFRCICSRGYSGVHCSEELSACEKYPCGVEAACINLPKNERKCLCPKGMTGESCTIDINECASNPCKNGGKCLESAIDRYECACSNAYHGINCEFEKTSCYQHSCQTGSTCVSLLNTYKCLCPFDRTGTFCEVSMCNPEINYCKNSGKCIEINKKHDENVYCECLPDPCHFGHCILFDTTNYYCKCFIGYYGDDCAEKINICEKKPCRNGGTCKVDDINKDQRQCFCLSNYNGEDCENMISCQIISCQNNGKFDCQLNACICADGFAGAYCEYQKDKCKPDPCHAGKCLITNDKNFRCDCQSDDVYGDRCQFKHNSNETFELFSKQFVRLVPSNIYYDVSNQSIELTKRRLLSNYQEVNPGPICPMNAALRQVSPNKQKCFFFSSNLYNFVEATDYCSKRNGKLFQMPIYWASFQLKLLRDHLKNYLDVFWTSTALSHSTYQINLNDEIDRSNQKLVIQNNDFYIKNKNERIAKALCESDGIELNEDNLYISYVSSFPMISRTLRKSYAAYRMNVQMIERIPMMFQIKHPTSYSPIERSQEGNEIISLDNCYFLDIRHKQNRLINYKKLFDILSQNWENNSLKFLFVIKQLYFNQNKQPVDRLYYQIDHYLDKKLNAAILKLPSQKQILDIWKKNMENYQFQLDNGIHSIMNKFVINIIKTIKSPNQRKIIQRINEQKLSGIELIGIQQMENTKSNLETPSTILRLVFHTDDERNIDKLKSIIEKMNLRILPTMIHDTDNCFDINTRQRLERSLIEKIVNYSFNNSEYFRSKNISIKLINRSAKVNKNDATFTNKLIEVTRYCMLNNENKNESIGIYVDQIEALTETKKIIKEIDESIEFVENSINLIDLKNTYRIVQIVKDRDQLRRLENDWQKSLKTVNATVQIVYVQPVNYSQSKYRLFLQFWQNDQMIVDPTKNNLWKLIERN
ncbi:hypothetical protein SNEBB_000637 [Seison nebaliae]|nr:hypothetical protein SNEBB_000637 [Seison nebaliae]